MQEQKALHWLRVLPLLFLTAQECAQAQQGCQPIAEIVSAQGEIRINGAIIDNASASRDRLRVCAGDLITSGELSRASLAILSTDAVIRLDQNTEFRINYQRPEDRSLLELIKGAINFLSPSPVDIAVTTAAVNAAVEGTEFHVRVDGDRATVTVLDGQVRVTDSVGGNELTLQENQAASARTGEAPTVDLSVSEANVGDAVQWAHFYPPITDLDQPAPGLTEGNAELHIRRAALALRRGGVSDAEAALAIATTLDPDNEQVWGLRLTIGLARYDRAKRADSSRKAEQIDSFLAEGKARALRSPAALIAFSYAQQWEFDLAGALKSLEKAEQIAPSNYLVLARLAEIWMSLGDLDRAVHYAERATSISTNARASTVLGFTYLAQRRTSDAEQTFKEAIGIDSSDPLPHLGLGLTQIRRGDLHNGRLRILASLAQDQQNSIIRSYLGKVYYEEHVEPEAGEQLAIARELDKNDPTAYFYDAVRLQTLNRPIEALRQLQKSIALNNNRAVYRSRLLLDQDLAARSASLGQIYRDLGFEQLALAEGWKSISSDVDEHSGHRLLADVYTTLPRHEIARANELFISQLLQPINVTPIKPQLAEANLFVLNNAGPSDLAFNEFNPIFDRNRASLQLSGVVGGNNTIGNDSVYFAISDRWSYSLGQFHYETDGFRENNDFTQDVYNAFIQFRPTYKSSIQAEVRSTETERGDLLLRFDPTNFRTAAREEEEVDSFRIGVRHSFGRRSKILASYVYQDAAGQLNSPPTLSATTNLAGHKLETQYIESGTKFDVLAGISYLQNDIDELLTVTAPIPVPPFFAEIELPESADVRHISTYFYTNLRPNEHLQITLGASGEILDGRDVELEKVYPKLGAIWEPSADTVIRLAAFRTIQRPFISKQNIQPSIEPTQVAGFNQFFFGVEGEEAWRFGVGIDQSFSEDITAGIEVSRRDRDVPRFEVAPVPQVVVTTATEDFARGYLYWTPSLKLALGGTYQFEDIDNNGTSFEEAVTQLKTHRLALQGNLFLSNGIRAGLSTTFVDQDGVFVDVNTGSITEGSDSFVTVDASFGYRLKKRRGSVSLAVRNITDEKMNFQDTDPENPSIFPERWVTLNVNLAFGS